MKREKISIDSDKIEELLYKYADIYGVEIEKVDSKEKAGFYFDNKRAEYKELLKIVYKPDRG